jgi:predicted RNase H-like nuclease (RuvC/YqgF family)
MDTLLAESISTFSASPYDLQTTIEKAIEPLLDRISSLEATVASQQEELAAMRTRIAAVESLEEQDVTRLACDIATDRRRIASLENPHREPGKTETSRAEKIEKYLSSRPDHRATFETLKGHLGIDNDLLGIAVRSLLPSGKYAVIKTPGDKRKRTLVMLPR